MPYVDPNSGQSPRGLVEDIHVVYDKGPTQFSWSIAQLKWDKRPAVGIRWNGDIDKPGSGQPQSRGNATWFILPDEIADAVISAATALEREKDNELYKSYCEMAADTEREAEAQAWSEALIGDAFETR